MFQNKIKLIAVIIFSGVMAILYNDYYMGILFLTVLLSPFILFAILCYVYGRLSFELISVVHVAGKGETIPISVQIHNPTIFPVSVLSISITYFNSFSDQLKENRQVFYISVDSRSTTNATFNLKSDYAGNIIISLSKVRIYDYLKIFSLKKKNLGEIKVAVLPNYYELTEDYFELSRMQIESDYYSNVKSGDDPSEVFAIREYREGDRLQRIHWKLSLKQDQLMIKEFSDPLNSSVVIFADLASQGRDDTPEIIDSILECVLSFSYSFILKGYIHYLAWYDKFQGSSRRVRISTEKDIYEAIDGILGCGPYNQDTDLAAAYYAEYPNDQYTDLFFITNIITNKKLDSLIFIKAMDRQIFYVSKGAGMPVRSSSATPQDITIDPVLEKKIYETGINLFFLDSEDLKTNLESLKFD